MATLARQQKSSMQFTAAPFGIFRSRATSWRAKPSNQKVDDPGLSRSSHVHHLFQKGLALNPPLGILPGVCKFNIIQPYGNAATLGTGMIFTLYSNAIALKFTPIGGLRMYCCTAER